ILSGKHVEDFRYDYNVFFYSNVVGSTFLLIIIAFIFSTLLTGKDRGMMKQSVSFGIKRSTIFWGKLLLTLAYFVALCIIGMLLMVFLGENFLPVRTGGLNQFLLATLNILPMILSGFAIIHTLKMIKFNDVYTLVVIFFIYVISGELVHLLFKPVSGLNELYKWMPNEILDDNLLKFVDQSVVLDYRSWLVGVLLIVISLTLGQFIFSKQNID